MNLNLTSQILKSLDHPESSGSLIDYDDIALLGLTIRLNCLEKGFI